VELAATLNVNGGHAGRIRMISRLVLKYLKGSRPVIRVGYGGAKFASSQFLLTAPAGRVLVDDRHKGLPD
jgi:hypothetical protein